nr:hypothetical protein BaRGS_001978 [Batillaria attramentaria]
MSTKRASRARIDATSAGYYNPGLALDDNNDVTVDVEGDNLHSGSTSASTAPPAASPQTWERFDDDGDVGVRVGQIQSGTKPPSSYQPPNVASAQRTAHHQDGGQPEPRILPPPAPSRRTVANGHPSPSTTNLQPPAPASGEQSPPADPASQQAVSSHPVHYDRQRDQVVVQGGAVGADPLGGAVIVTRGSPERWSDLPERPLTARHMKLLKIFSVASVILFFPSGIPAMYYAWRTQREFDEGILRGNIDRAQKFRRRAEHLIILSAVLAVMMAVLVFALVERAQRGDPAAPHSYVAHNPLHTG